MSRLSVGTSAWIVPHLPKDWGFKSQDSMPTGVKEIHPLPKDLNEYEKEGIAKALPELASSIHKGIKFAKEVSQRDHWLLPSVPMFGCSHRCCTAPLLHANWLHTRAELRLMLLQGTI